MESLKMIFLLVLGSGLVHQANGQPDTLWTKTYSGLYYDGGQSVQQTSDGGYIITGGINDKEGGVSDVGLFKVNALGDTLWSRNFGGKGDDWGDCVQQTCDGGYIVSGSTASFGAGGYDFWLIKTDSSGDTSWTKTYGGVENDCGYALDQTSDSGYIVVGFTESFKTNYDSDLWLIKTNSMGDTIWTQIYGGDESENCYSVQETRDKGFIITGITSSFGVNNLDVWLVKTDAMGDLLWKKTFEARWRDWGNWVQEIRDGGYIITGYTSQDGVDNDVLLIRTDSLGNKIWTKTFGGKGSESGNYVQETENGDYIIAGTTNSFGAGYNDVWLIRTNSNGDTLWTKTFGGKQNDGAQSVQQTTDGGFIIAGFTGSFGMGSFDFWLIKTASDPVGVEKEITANLTMYQIYQNYPNPFNLSTVISWQITAGSHVELSVYNLLGEKVATLVSEKMNAGNHTYTFDGKNLASGVYYYQLVAGDFREVKKMILLK